MALKDLNWTIKISNFHLGLAPFAHLDSLTEVGDAGQSSAMANVDVISIPKTITQGPGLTTLTYGAESGTGVVTELIKFIMDKAVAADVTFGIGPTKLFKISSTTVASGGSPSWPQVITGAAEDSLGAASNSLIDLNGNIYGFWNNTTVGDILKMPISTEVIDPDWGSTVPTGKAALVKAPHPVAAKEDIICFGNGQYLGTFVDSTTTLSPTKLNFKVGNQVDDVVFHANQWLIAVNSGVSGTNRTTSQIYFYDGSAVSTILSDEAAVGVQRIGFLYPLNGVVYVAYQDLSSSGGFKIGYLAGRQLKALRSFTGTLPTFAQKTLYKNTILFLSNALIYSCGSVSDQVPFQISQLADAGYSTVGAIAAPFGTPMVASTQSTSFKLAKFSGYDVSSTWYSLVFPLINGNFIGYIDSITVRTKVLGTSARCDLIVQANQGVTSGNTLQIKTTGKTRHSFNKIGLKSIEDFRIYLNWANGSTSNDALIKFIEINGRWVEK